MTKICILATSLGKGGAEKSSANLSVLLADLGYEVHVLITKNIVSYKYSGTLFSLESKLKKPKNEFKKVLLLKKYFTKNKFDFIIDNRPRSQFFKEFILYKYVFNNSNIISIIHSYKTQNYMPTNKVLAHILYKNIFKLVTVSKAIKTIIERKYALNNVECIYNAIDIPNIKKLIEINLPENYILFYGRLEEKVKNLSLLIRGYKASNLKEKGVKLIVLGEGPDMDLIKNLINKLELSEDIILKSFTPNPFPYVINAKFTVLTSRYEGFPMSIIESLACETPVISVDCKSGPKELIKHKENGLLIENYNIKALSNAMNLFVEDEKLYSFCKKNSKASISHLKKQKIGKQWKKTIDGYV